MQIWILPNARDLPPGYEQKTFSDEELRGKLRLIASDDGREGSVTIHQDARVYATLLDAGLAAEHPLSSGRYAWIQVASGVARVNDLELKSGQRGGK